MQEYILEMRNITKEFPGVKALDRVSFQVKKGDTLTVPMSVNGGFAMVIEK